MARARRHQRLLAALAFGFLAFVAELAGRSLTHRVDRALHVAAPVSSSETYYPFLLAGVKVAAALLLARVSWRFVRAHAAARAGRRVLSALGRPAHEAPRVRLDLSPRLWLLSFAATSLCYLLQTDLERLSQGRWPLLAPWLHTYALPVFAVLAVLAALVWSVGSRWLAEYESYAEATVARAFRLSASPGALPTRRTGRSAGTPRSLFGIAFESRPPPVPA